MRRIQDLEKLLALGKSTDFSFEGLILFAVPTARLLCSCGIVTDDLILCKYHSDRTADTRVESYILAAEILGMILPTEKC